MTVESDFEIKVYLILSSAYGKFDLVLRDTVTTLREIGYGTEKLNRYEYEIEPEEKS